MLHLRAFATTMLHLLLAVMAQNLHEMVRGGGSFGRAAAE